MLSLANAYDRDIDVIRLVKRHHPHSPEWLRIVKLSGYLMSILFLFVWVGIWYAAFSRKSGDIIQPKSQSTEEVIFLSMLCVVGLVATVGEFSSLWNLF
jgi:hypothetical protein